MLSFNKDIFLGEITELRSKKKTQHVQDDSNDKYPNMCFINLTKHA